MRRLAWLWEVGIVMIAMPAVLSAGQTTPQKEEAVRQGQQLYRTHCASCHGAAGHGDGPLTQYLNVPPANLTGIAARNRGVFPADVVHRIIDGRRVLKTHGDSSMPIWGDVFSLSGSADAEKATAARIRALVAYIETLQERPGN
jgi:mono/diheme cytochrome c family protein